MNIPHISTYQKGVFEDILQGPAILIWVPNSWTMLRLHTFSVRSKADVLHLVHGGAGNLLNFTESTIVYS